jgi:hypothetical protein
MSTKIKPQVGVVYECYKGFTDSHGDRCRVGQKYIFKGGEAYENDDYYYMDKASRRGAQIEIAKDKFASHFCPANCEQAKQESDIEFKVGDEVMIDESSEYYGDCDRTNPKDTIGVISDIIDTDFPDELGIIVDWPTGQTNSYNKSDLKLAKQKSYIDSDKNKPLKQQVMINAIAITDPEQIKALAIAIPSIKPQLQAQFPDLFITHKAGNRYENVDSGEEYILAHESNAVALVNLSTGTITSNTIHVDDIDNITADEFARMVNNPSDYELL